MEIVNHFSELIEKKGWASKNRVELAELLEVSPVTLRKWFKGDFDKIDLTVARQIGEKLGCKKLSDLIEVKW